RNAYYRFAARICNRPGYNSPFDQIDGYRIAGTIEPGPAILVVGNISRRRGRNGVAAGWEISLAKLTILIGPSRVAFGAGITHQSDPDGRAHEAGSGIGYYASANRAPGRFGGTSLH